jgi:hypothetical protein
MRSSNKRLLSIFKQCCEKGTRERCRRRNSEVLARERQGVGPVAPAPRSAFSPVVRRGFSLWNQSPRSELSRCGRPQSHSALWPLYAWPRFGEAFSFSSRDRPEDATVGNEFHCKFGGRFVDVAGARCRLRSGRTNLATVRSALRPFATQDHLVGTVTGPPSGRPS